MHDHSTKNWSSLIYFICTGPFDLKLGSSLIYFFYLHTTIRPNYMVLFHYSFLNARPFDQKLGSTLIYVFYLYTTIWPKIRVPINLFFYLHTTIWAKMRVLIDLFFLFVYDHQTKLYGPLSFIALIFRTLYPWLYKSPFSLKQMFWKKSLSYVISTIAVQR